MNIFVTLVMGSLACLVMADVEVTKERFVEVVDKCQTESGATDEDVAAMLNQLPSSGTPAKCLRNCIMQKFEMTNADGKLLKEPTVAMLKFAADNDAAKEAMAEEIAHTCIDTDTKLPADACEAAEENCLCLIKEVKAKGFKPIKL